MRVLLTGIPGVGKSGIGTSAASRAGWSYVNFGTEMLDLARPRGLAKSRDDLRKLSGSVLRGLRLEVAERLGHRARTLIDCHLTIRQTMGYAAIQDEVVTALALTSIVVVEADPVVVIERRSRDKTRDRDEETVAELGLHQKVNFAAAWAIAAPRGLPVLLVDASAGVEGSAERQLHDYLRTAGGEDAQSTGNS